MLGQYCFIDRCRGIFSRTVITWSMDTPTIIGVGRAQAKGRPKEGSHYTSCKRPFCPTTKKITCLPLQNGCRHVVFVSSRTKVKATLEGALAIIPSGCVGWYLWLHDTNLLCQTSTPKILDGAPPDCCTLQIPPSLVQSEETKKLLQYMVLEMSRQLLCVD